MAEAIQAAPRPAVYSIAAHRGFADALVAGLIPRYSDPDLGLARLTLLLPNRRSVRTVTEAFVRLAEGGMLLPRMCVIGDSDLDEGLGPLLDPLGAGAEIPPAADPNRRWLRLAAHISDVLGEAAPRGAALLRMAHETGQTMDRLLVDGVSPDDLLSEDVIAVVGNQARHWGASTRTFLQVQDRWLRELQHRGEVDLPTRRNLLFAHAAQRWTALPPAHPIVAAGITSASPALAGLLRVVAGLPRGAVILPDLDLSLDDEVWQALGSAGVGKTPGDPPFTAADAVTHPQYHLKLLLNRMKIARDEVRPWHRAGLGAAPAQRSHAISSLFLPPAASATWVGMTAQARNLPGVRLVKSAHPEHEAQTIALLLREALEVPERRAALVTPDRGLAARVAAHLQRWGIAADDTAGSPLSQTAAGRVVLLLAEVLAEQAAPVPLIALLSHPKVREGDGRPAWLEAVRRLDLALRGPRPDAGLEPLRHIAADAGLDAWWATVEGDLAPLFAATGAGSLDTALAALMAAAEALCGEAVWGGADGRALSAFLSELHLASADAETVLAPADLLAVLRDAMDRVAVRPPWGGHPRLTIYGLIEARMARADLVICGGLVEGVWPASSAPDSLLPPAVLRALGVPGPEFRIGLAAHDLAAALGAPEVVLSHAARDAGAPVIPSRFVLRIKAMLGDQAKQHLDRAPSDWAAAIDRAAALPPYRRPRPMPAAEQRRVPISVTGLDRLRSDPYQFYAGSILHLRAIDPLDAEPSPAWLGTAVHAVLDAWHKAGSPAGQLAPQALTALSGMNAHPLVRALWGPRLIAALRWVDAQLAAQTADQRVVLATEAWGEMVFNGVRVFGRADRIDRLANGALAVVDYKTGQPPSGKMVQQGYSLQLGLTALLAERGAFAGVSGTVERFEYWSLAKKAGSDSFGFMREPVREGRAINGLPRDEFVDQTARFLTDAIDRWIIGNDPFTARLNPDIGGYNDFDQLMRLDEWLPNLTLAEAAEG